MTPLSAFAYALATAHWSHTPDCANAWGECTCHYYDDLRTLGTALDSSEPILDAERLAEILAGHRESDGRYTPPLTGDPIRLMGPREFARDIAGAYSRAAEPAR